MVETLRSLNIISNTRTTFKPDNNVSRAEAYAMLMTSVCMPIEGSNADWQQNVYETAKKQGLTSKTDFTSFRPTREILRQELFVIAGAAADYAQQTGGCGCDE